MRTRESLDDYVNSTSETINNGGYYKFCRFTIYDRKSGDEMVSVRIDNPSAYCKDGYMMVFDTVRKMNYKVDLYQTSCINDPNGDLEIFTVGDGYRMKFEFGNTR